MAFTNDTLALIEIMATGSSTPSAPKRGRPKRGFETKRISLKESVFDYWNAKKDILGYGDKTHSEFAEYLLEAVDDQIGSLCHHLDYFAQLT